MKKYSAKFIHIFLIIIVALVSTNAVFAQANLEVYGQNRVQYRSFKWKYFDTKHFRIYHYDRAGRDLARYVAEQVENDIEVIEHKMGGKFPHRFNIVLYNSYDEYRQTNIGKKNDSKQGASAGTVDLVGDKLVVYFTGVHTDIRRQTRAGMSRVIMERMLFGENLRDVVRNAVLANLPEWTVYGFISYLVDGWDTKSNSDWKSLIEMYPKLGFHELAEKDPELAGKAFWKYVSDKYGENNMKNLVYSMQLKGSLNQALKSTIGQKVRQAYDSAMVFYQDVYAQDIAQRQVPDSANALIEIDVPKDGTVLRDIKVSPKGADVAYVTWKNGEYKVYIQRTTKQQTKAVVLQRGVKDFNEKADQNYPIITWSNTGYKLAILYKIGQETHLRIYNSIKARVENYEIPPNRFDRVLGMAFMEDDDKMIFSAIKKSQTDLYEFTIRGKRMKNITDDAWDDLSPWYVSGGSKKGILFLSNRPKANLDVPLKVNQLPNGPMNVFFYNTQTGEKELLQMSYIKDGNAIQPIQYGPENFAYLYDENGIQNQYVVMLGRTVDNKDSAYAVPITNYPTNIISHQYNAASSKIGNVIREGGKYKVYYHPVSVPKKDSKGVNLAPTVLSKSEEDKTSSVLNVQGGDTPAKPLLKKGNTFQSNFDEEEDNKTQADNITTSDDNDVVGTDTKRTTTADSIYIKMRAYPYRISFKPDFFSVRLDNSVLFTKYQPAGQNGNQYNNPDLGGMITVTLDDVLEDHKLTGGIRLPINFSGVNYFFQYENFKRRIDWGILYLRTQKRSSYLVEYVDANGNPVLQNEQLGINRTNLVQFSASYPFSRRSSLRMHLGVRNDKLTFKAQDTFSLSYEPDNGNQNWIISRAEYVFDNTITPTINIYNGTRYKIYAEYMYRATGGGGFYNFGADARYYKKIYKNFIWAFRAAAAHSEGNQKILYFAGGVDNWLGNPDKIYDQTNIRSGQDYAFQTIATNLRGYKQNSWNGNTYAVINTEFRLPILTTFMKKPLQSSILRNLQAVAFADLGSAWSGVWPTDANVANNILLANSNTPVTLILDDESNGIGLGYGLGLRTMVFGYFIRFDYAFNAENKSLAHFSIGTDF